MRIRIAMCCVVVVVLIAGIGIWLSARTMVLAYAGEVDPEQAPDPSGMIQASGQTVVTPAPVHPPTVVNPYYLQANSVQQLTVQPLPDGRLLLRGSIGHKTFADWGTTISQFAQIYKVYGGKIVPDGEYFLRQADGDFALPGHVWTRSR